MGFWVWKWVFKCLVKCIGEAHESPLNLLATMTWVIFGAKSTVMQEFPSPPGYTLKELMGFTLNKKEHSMNSSRMIGNLPKVFELDW